MKSLKMSATANFIVGSGYGFRSDSGYGPECILFEDVLTYEVFELGNTDVFDYCRRTYGLKFLDLRKKQFCITQLLNYFYDVYGISKLYTSDRLYCIWLTSYTDAKDLYSYGNDIRRYKLNNDSIIVSDLGNDGVLLISKTPFHAIVD